MLSVMPNYNHVPSANELEINNLQRFLWHKAAELSNGLEAAHIFPRHSSGYKSRTFISKPVKQFP